jgi:uroporphyrinogen-III synthase
VLLPLFQQSEVASPTPESRYDAIVLTSAAGAVFLRSRIARAAPLAALLRIPVYCVGTRTANAAVEAGFQHCRSAGGDGESLAALLREAVVWPARRNVRILYACARHRAFDLAAALPEADVTELTVYEAKPVDPGKAALERALDAVVGGAAFLYSARSAQHLFGLATKYGVAERLSSLTLIAISENVAAAAPGPARRKILVAQSPDEASMMEMLDMIWLKRSDTR